MQTVARMTAAERRIPTLPVRPFTVREYHQLLETGILKSGDPFELLNGWIVPKMTIHPPHNKAVRLLNRRFSRLLSDDWILQIQGSITLPPANEPEPDVVVAFGPEDRYVGVNPGPRDIVLIVEVADSSLSEDRDEKLIIYARAHIPEYWIVNLIDRQIEVYTQPRGGRNPRYGQRKDYGSGEKVAVMLAGIHAGDIGVDEVLP
jgi:Uma2 family endonuclease